MVSSKVFAECEAGEARAGNPGIPRHSGKELGCKLINPYITYNQEHRFVVTEGCLARNNLVLTLTLVLSEC